MIERIIELCAKHKWVVFAVTLALTAWALVALKQTPLDAIPDLSDPQVIVYTDWMGRSPDLVEDQVTYPLVRALQSTPKVRTVRGYSMFGMSFIYVVFEDDTDLYWARTRVFEQLGRAQQVLPEGVTPVLGPDASGVGWIYQYALQDASGKRDLAALRELQDFTIRPALQAVPGVSEVASIGGFERQFQVLLDPNRLSAFGVSAADVARAVREANSEVGARVLELSGREYILRGRGYVGRLKDLEDSVVSLGAGGNPIRVRDVAAVQFGPEIRRGTADLNGQGETVGGIVVMRIGSNALEVNNALKQQLEHLVLPDGVHVVPTYDRSDLILGSIETLRTTLLEEGAIVALICLVFLLHVRSALVAIVILPLSVLLSFIGMRALGMSSNIMSLGGIAIAVGELSDAAIVLIENAHVRLAEAAPGADRKRIIIDACKEVGRPIFFSLLLITVSFLPIFTLAGQAGRLFRPLAYTKTFAMLAASILSVTLAPPLMVLLLRGRFRREAENPLNRLLGFLYRPVVRQAVRFRWLMVLVALLGMGATVPLAMRLGSEFMPPLDEGSLLVMPTTFPGISIEEARRALTAQNRIIMGFAEVQSVHGKAGRAETATDPAQLDMIESVVTLKSRSQWPRHAVSRWFGNAPSWVRAPLGRLWPEQEPRTLDQLAGELTRALQMPGFQIAVSPPIRTRIDMLTTGVRTPVGIKVMGSDLAQMEQIATQLEGVLREVPGTRSTFAERQTGREYIDIVPDREAIARYGLTMRQVHEVIEAAVGGMPVSSVVAGRARFSVNVRYAADFRADPEALRAILIPVQSSPELPLIETAGAGQGSSMSSGSGPMQAMRGGAVQVGMDPQRGMRGMNTSRGTGSMPASGGAGASGPTGMSSGEIEGAQRWQSPTATVPLGAIADVRIVTGPPMIKDENGVLTGYVFADLDTNSRDLGGWVNDAKRTVAERVVIPAGYRLQWTGQYEFMAEMQDRLAYVLPLTFVLIVVLLYMSLNGWPQTLLVLLSLPFALAGSIWLLSAMGYHLSTAVWVGLIAVGGVAAETGTVMVVYLDEAIERRKREHRLNTPSDVDHAVVEGAASRARPLLMTVATTVLGLLPLLWEGGVGADVSARTAAPVVGGLWSCMFLTLLVLPAVYATWRRAE
ncbi:MAG TPA: efflux RND transporter permease subunit, partial [Polyangiaceae bacterium]|nr:efflux RND transporter permease subunit [Polyangiaceae bacterium]